MIIPAILAVTLLAAFGLLAASKKDAAPSTPGVPGLPPASGSSPSDTPPAPMAELPGGAPAGAAVDDGPGTGQAVLPPGALPPSATPGPSSIAPVVTAGRPTISMKLKSTGDYVKQWQTIVGGIKVDGIFGIATDQATRKFQQVHGLAIDGIVGPKTWQAALSMPVVSPPPGIAAPVGTGSGATSVAPNGSVDDAFDVLIATAIAKHDIAQLTALAAQAEARGLLDVARSIRDAIALMQNTAPPATPPGPTKPVVASVKTPAGRAVISMAAGSKGADVIEWQRILEVKQDGIFGKDTDAKTRTWQTAHGLTADGIVGPKSWAAAYAVQPALATTPRPQVVVTTSAARPTISMKAKSTGDSVKEWQGLIGVKADGIFGMNTDTETRKWQKVHGLTVDGVVGPNTWAAAYVRAPALAVVPTTQVSSGIPAKRSDGFLTPLSPVAESDGRVAARELTDYLTSIGGLSGRGKEDKKRVSAWLSRLGKPDPSGMYGRDGATAVMLQGFVPITPYYWPKTGAAAAKTAFLNVVNSYAAADTQRAPQWATLKADINRA